MAHRRARSRSPAPGILGAACTRHAAKGHACRRSGQAIRALGQSRHPQPHRSIRAARLSRSDGRRIPRCHRRAWRSTSAAGNPSTSYGFPRSRRAARRCSGIVGRRSRRRRSGRPGSSIWAPPFRSARSTEHVGTSSVRDSRPRSRISTASITCRNTRRPRCRAVRSSLCNARTHLCAWRALTERSRSAGSP